jgi:branched-chain amino acid transport system ATP-binding protein
MADLLTVHGLTKRFGGLTATDNLSLAVRAGETHALIGPNGAGKTTLIHQLSGAMRPNAGDIVFAGADVTHRRQHERVHVGLARSYQITSIFGAQTVLENLVLAVLARSGSSLRFWRPVHRERALYEEAHALAESVGLAARTHAAAGTLAHGEQRQLEVGLALATKARLLLLDEPMAGMGPEESAAMVTLLERLKGTVAILLVEHDMDAVFRLADRISVLVSGRIIATGRPEEIRSNLEVKRAYLGDGSQAVSASRGCA